MSTWNRRDFLQASGAGIAALSMPGFLAACGGAGRTATPPAPPDNPFLAWFGIDEPMLQRVIGELTSRGATHADAYFQHARTSSVRLEDGIVSLASTSIEQGVGLRTVIGDQVGFAFTEDLSEGAMRTAARTAASIAQGSALAAPAHLEFSPDRPSYYTVQVPWADVGIDRKLPLVTRIEQLARAADPAVKKVTVGWIDVDERMLVASKDGLLATDSRPMVIIYVTVTAEKNGVRQSHTGNLASRRGFETITEGDLKAVATQAVDRTMRLFDARRPPAGELPVVLDAGASGILLHEAIGHGLEADFNRKGTSIYSTMLGKRIAPEFVTIVDDGTIAHERGALNLDDEGRPTERTVLVENGILKSYLHDQISAAHYKVPTTGSGRRESYRFAPMPRMRCTFMENGPHSRDEIIASIKGKAVLAETFTNGQVQIGAGDFTFYVKNGWLIENGKITAPIKDVNLIGNGPEVLKKITMAANDSKLDTGGWTCGKDGQGVPVSQGQPTVLVSAITVGGENV
jgi:TldD protein